MLLRTGYYILFQKLNLKVFKYIVTHLLLYNEQKQACKDHSIKKFQLSVFISIFHKPHEKGKIDINST